MGCREPSRHQAGNTDAGTRAPTLACRTRACCRSCRSLACRLQLSLADFELLRRIGDGSYSHVVLARHRETGVEYALKVVDKQYILRCAPARHSRWAAKPGSALPLPG